jgi:hypothetical protein
MATQASLLGCIAEGDRLRALPLAVRVALVQGLQVTSAEQLLGLPDALLRTALTNAVGCGPRGVADFDRWLSEQRGGRGEPVQQQVHARAHADALLGKARDDIGAAIRTVIERDDLAAADVARRCGTTQDAVAKVTSGGSPSTLEVAVRMALSLGVRIDIKIVP